MDGEESSERPDDEAGQSEADEGGEPDASSASDQEERARNAPDEDIENSADGPSGTDASDDTVDRDDPALEDDGDDGGERLDDEGDSVDRDEDGRDIADRESTDHDADPGTPSSGDRNPDEAPDPSAGPDGAGVDGRADDAGSGVLDDAEGAEGVDDVGAGEPEDESAEIGPDDEGDPGELDVEDETGDPVEDGVLGGAGGPEEDREMPLADHIEEMLKRLAVVIAIAGLVSLIVFPLADQIINFLWYSVMPGVPSDIARPRLYGILEKFFTELKVASLAGLIVALPVLVYETYAFMRPGLYPHERRYYLAAIPTSLVLAIVGVAFAYFIVLPAIFTYFLYYSQDVATIGFALGRTFDLVLLMMGYLAVVFQIPLFIMLAMMMGLVTRRWLADRRLLFWGAFLGISFLFGFDPTGMAPILVAATMIVLFEGTLLLTKWTGRE